MWKNQATAFEMVLVLNSFYFNRIVIIGDANLKADYLTDPSKIGD